MPQEARTARSSQARRSPQPPATRLPTSPAAPVPFYEHDLRDRLARTRWPDQLPGVGWDYGIPLDYVRELAGYWRTGYDWRVHETRLNEFDQFTTAIDGQRIHFLHVRSAEAGALPLIITHGWPGSIVEFMNIIGPTHLRGSWPGLRRSSARGPTAACRTRRSTATSSSPTSRCTG
jgi:hypothetical protein